MQCRRDTAVRDLQRARARAGVGVGLLTALNVLRDVYVRSCLQYVQSVSGLATACLCSSTRGMTGDPSGGHFESRYIHTYMRSVERPALCQFEQSRQQQRHHFTTSRLHGRWRPACKQPLTDTRITNTLSSTATSGFRL